MKLNYIAEDAFLDFYNHLGAGSLGVITSFRPENKNEVNWETIWELKGILTTRRYSPLLVYGSWRGRVEPALLVPHVTLGHLMELGHRYHQEAVIYKGPETDGVPAIVYIDGKVLYGWTRLTST